MSSIHYTMIKSLPPPPHPPVTSMLWTRHSSRPCLCIYLARKWVETVDTEEHPCHTQPQDAPESAAWWVKTQRPVGRLVTHTHTHDRPAVAKERPENHQDGKSLPAKWLPAVTGGLRTRMQQDGHASSGFHIADTAGNAKASGEKADGNPTTQRLASWLGTKGSPNTAPGDITNPALLRRTEGKSWAHGSHWQLCLALYWVRTF